MLRDLLRKELTLLIWGAVSGRHEDSPRASANLCYFRTAVEGPAPDALALHSCSQLNSEKIKVTPLKSAWYSSNLFLVSLAAFSILWVLFIWLLPQHSQRPV